MLGVQQLVSTLHTVGSIIDTIGQCKDCHWSGEGGEYCGLGVVPVGICLHRYSNEELHDGYQRAGP